MTLYEAQSLYKEARQIVLGLKALKKVSFRPKDEEQTLLLNLSNQAMRKAYGPALAAENTLKNAVASGKRGDIEGMNAIITRARLPSMPMLRAFQRQASEAHTKMMGAGKGIISAARIFKAKRVIKKVARKVADPIIRAEEFVEATPAARAIIAASKVGAEVAEEIGYKTAKGFQRIGNVVIKSGQNIVEGAEKTVWLTKYLPLVLGGGAVIVLLMTLKSEAGGWSQALRSRVRR